MPARPTWLVRATIAGAVLVTLGLAPILAAPDVEATCTHVLALVEPAGEPTGEPEQAACTQRFTQLRRDRGILGWAILSWCTRVAATVEEAARC
jgi:hypothetical protein